MWYHISALSILCLCSSHRIPFFWTCISKYPTSFGMNGCGTFLPSFVTLQFLPTTWRKHLWTTRLNTDYISFIAILQKSFTQRNRKFFLLLSLFLWLIDSWWGKSIANFIFYYWIIVGMSAACLVLPNCSPHSWSCTRFFMWDTCSVLMSWWLIPHQSKPVGC